MCGFLAPQLGRGGPESSVEETVESPAPNRVLAEAAHPAGASEERRCHVHRPAWTQVQDKAYSSTVVDPVLLLLYYYYY